MDKKEIQKYIIILAGTQTMHCYNGYEKHRTYSISTAKNGLGEKLGSECTPRGWHAIHNVIGLKNEINSVFVAREWTGEIYSEELFANHPDRDWILTRIIQLSGLEPGFNQGGDVDSLSRYIYIHGTPDRIKMGVLGSRGCIRMRNLDIIELAEWVNLNTRIYIG